MSVIEVLTLLLVIFAALSYIDNKHNKKIASSKPPKVLGCYFALNTEGIRFCI